MNRLNPSQPPRNALSYKATEVPGAAFRNFGTDSANILKGWAQSIPALGRGALEVGKRFATLQPAVTDQEIATGVEMAKQIPGYIASRYGSWDNFKRTVAEHPAGFLLDLSSVVSGGAGAIGKSRNALSLAENEASRVASLGGPRMNHLAESIDAPVVKPVPVAPKAAPVTPTPVAPKAIPAAPIYTYNPLDVEQDLSGKILFHGTRAPIKTVEDLDPVRYGNVKGLYGPGLYLTDSPLIAKGYSKTRSGSVDDMKVLPAVLQNKPKLIDLEKQLPPDAHDIFARTHYAYNTPLGGTGSRYDYIQPGMTGKQAVEALKEAMSDEGLHSSDALEIYQNLYGNLKSAGYDGFRHEGGGLTKAGQDHGPHNVVILFGEDGGRPMSDVVRSHIK